MERMTTTQMPRQTVGLAAGAMLAFALFSPLGARQAPPGGVCRVTGRATGGRRRPPARAPPGQGGGPARGGKTLRAETEAAAVGGLLPPGFSPDGSGDAIAITGTNASLDRGMMQDRFDAIGRGVFDPASGDFGAGFGPPGGPGGID